MSERQLFNLVHGRKSPDGQKTFWNRVGMAIYYPEDNRIGIHLDSVPVGEWDGWLTAFPKESDEERQEPQGSSRPSKQDSRSQRKPSPNNGEFVDNIPF